MTISAEHTDFAWVTPEEAIDRIDVEGVKEDVRNYMKKNETVWKSISEVKLLLVLIDHSLSRELLC